MIIALISWVGVVSDESKSHSHNDTSMDLGMKLARHEIRIDGAITEFFIVQDA